MCRREYLSSQEGEDLITKNKRPSRKPTFTFSLIFKLLLSGIMLLGALGALAIVMILILRAFTIL